MNSNFEHNENRPPSMQDVETVLQKLRPAKSSNPQVLAINNRRIMHAKANGYPKDMYHASLDPVQALNEDVEVELRALGYQDAYIQRSYPKHLFRRNFDQRFALKRDPATKEPQNSDAQGFGFVENRVVRDEKTEKELLAAPVPSGCGPWVSKLTDIAPLPNAADEEDKELQIARLEGQLAEARTTKSAKRSESAA